MSDVINVDDSNFEKEVLKAEIPVLVDFSAAWCGPCQRQHPILEKFATEHQDKVKVVIVDIDDAPDVTSKLGVRRVPSLILFNGGVRIETKVGLTSLGELNSLLTTKIG